MRTVMKALPQLALMAAIVATLVYWPAGVVLALALALFGGSLGSVLTFGGSLGTLVGMAAWWLLIFAGACVYAAWAFPWEDKMMAWPGKK